MINRGLVRLASIACAALCGVLAVFYIINIIREFPDFIEMFKYDGKYGTLKPCQSFLSYHWADSVFSSR